MKQFSRKLFKRNIKLCHCNYLKFLQAKNGGIAMVPFYTYFITCNSTATIKDVIGKRISDFIQVKPNIFFFCQNKIFYC